MTRRLTKHRRKMLETQSKGISKPSKTKVEVKETKMNKKPKLDMDNIFQNRAKFVANSSKRDGSQSGMLIEIDGFNGKVKKIDIPNEISETKLKDKLLSHGVVLPIDKKYLNEIIDSLYQQQKLAIKNGEKPYIKIDGMGWCKTEGGDLVFLTSDRHAEMKEGVYIFDRNSLDEDDSELDAVSHSGTLGDWQNEVLEPSKEHKQILFSLYLAFSSVILKISRTETAIFHSYGPSSIGKTVAAIVGSSVFAKGGVDNWKSSGPGITRLSATHKDRTIYLDDVAKKEGTREQKTKALQHLAYTLSSDKDGAITKDGGTKLRKTVQFSSMVSSSGEFPIIFSNNDGAVSGANARFFNLAYLTHDLHRGENLYSFSYIPKPECEKICDAAQKYYGTPLIAFVEYLENYIKTKGEDKLKKWISKIIYNYNRSAKKELGICIDDNFVARISSKFGLLYAAGVLASKSGVLASISNEEIKKTILSTHSTLLYTNKIEEKDKLYRQKKLFANIVQELRRLESNGKIKALDSKKKPAASSIDKRIWKHKSREGVMSLYISSKKLQKMFGTDKASILLMLKAKGMVHQQLPFALDNGKKPSMYRIKYDAVIKHKKTKKKRVKK